MAGLFPSIANSQNVDRNGMPLANAELSVYNGGTLQLSAVYQDINLLLASANPMKADIEGRLPVFYVADGIYRVRLLDQDGVLKYDYPQIASIGASSSGGGGTSVDPTTIAQTGDEIFRKVGGLRAGWVRQNAQTIGSATSGASERANADCQNLFLYLWNNYPDTKCPVLTGRGATAAADWGANKQITLPDMRGRGASGVDGMGAARANVIPNGNVLSGGGDTGDTNAAFGGEANHVLVNGEMPTHNHGGSTGNDTPDHTHTQDGSNGTSANAPGFAFPGYVSVNNKQTGGASTRHTHPIGNDGGGLTHNNMAPFVLGTWYIKL